MGRCKAMVRGLVCALCTAWYWGVVTAQSGEEGQPDESAVDSNGKQCVRYWWTSMWGYVVALVALTMDFWGFERVLSTSIVDSVFMTFLLGVLNPLFMVFGMLENAICSMAMVGNLCGGVLGHEFVVPLYPWSKSKIKILVGARVVVNLLPEVHKQVVTSLRAFLDEVSSEDFSEAIVIGTKVKNSSECNVELTYHGKMALLRAKILPPYDQLKVLRGNSTLGMFVGAAQAIGYIYAIAVRRHQGLQVSPIEAIACFLNIVVLMKVVLHNFASVGHRFLLLYLTCEEEAKFIEECNNVSSFELKTTTKVKIASCIAIGFLSVVVMYFIVYFKHSLNGQCMVPIVLFQVNIIFTSIVWWLRTNSDNVMSTQAFIVVILTMVLNAIGYTWALAVSFKYWKEEKFDVQSSNYLSQVLPYIG